MSVTVYGASDDLIKVEGDIIEEFGYRGDEEGDDRGDLLAFSDGTVLHIVFADSGIWRITPVVQGTCTLDIQQAPEDDGSNYTDRARLGDNATVRWVIRGDAIAKRNGR